MIAAAALTAAGKLRRSRLPACSCPATRPVPTHRRGSPDSAFTLKGSEVDYLALGNGAEHLHRHRHDHSRREHAADGPRHVPRRDRRLPRSHRHLRLPCLDRSRLECPRGRLDRDARVLTDPTQHRRRPQCVPPLTIASHGAVVAAMALAALSLGATRPRRRDRLSRCSRPRTGRPSSLFAAHPDASWDDFAASRSMRRR